MNSVDQILLAWYAVHGRELPWRTTRDPYLIWLSEIILQQTRVDQGTAYYLRFVERFPRVDLLAQAPEDEVLKLWQGLGYYSRARNLHAAAQQIVNDFGGQFPSTYDAVRSLRGVGDYTAAAITSAAFDLPYAAVDGNGYRVLSRLYDVATPIDSTQGHREFQALATATMAQAKPSLYNQAVMDLGAMICTPRSPRCEECPLHAKCQAAAAGTIADRPVKQGKTKVRERWFNYLDLRSVGEAVLLRRGAGDIWQGLYEFPLIETAQEADFKTLAQQVDFIRWVGSEWTLEQETSLPAHRLSHQLIHAVVWQISVPRFTPDARIWSISEDDIAQRAVPRLLERYLMKKGEF